MTRVSTGKERDAAYKLYAREIREVIPMAEEHIIQLWEKLPDRYRGFWREKVSRPDLKFQDSSWALLEDKLLGE